MLVQSGSDAQSRIRSNAWSRCQPSRSGLPRAAKAAQRPFAVGSGRVDEHSCHGLVFKVAARDPLRQRSRVIAALDRQVPDHRMGERMQEDVSHPGKACRRFEVSRRTPSPVCLNEIAGLLAGAIGPLTNGLFREMKEDALATSFGRRHPGWCAETVGPVALQEARRECQNPELKRSE